MRKAGLRGAWGWKLDGRGGGRKAWPSHVCPWARSPRPVLSRRCRQHGRAAFWGPATVSPRLITITRESRTWPGEETSFSSSSPSSSTFFSSSSSRKPRDDEPSLPFTGLLRWRAFNGSLSPLPPSFPERIVLPFFFPSFLSSVSAISIFCCYQFLGRKFLPPRDKQPVYLSFYLSVHHFLSSLRDGLLWPGWLLRKRGMEKGIREKVIVLPRIRWSENTQVLDRIVRKVINLFHPFEYNIKVYK